MHQATFEGWKGRKAGTASEFIAIVIRRLKNRHRHERAGQGRTAH